ELVVGADLGAVESGQVGVAPPFGVDLRVEQVESQGVDEGHVGAVGGGRGAALLVGVGRLGVRGEDAGPDDAGQFGPGGGGGAGGAVGAGGAGVPGGGLDPGREGRAGVEE